MRPPLFVTLLSKRGESRLIEALDQQLAVALQGAVLAGALVQRKVEPDKAHAQMEEIEHKGDLQRARLVTMLSASLASPIDREDMFRLSRSIDDVLDTLRDFVRETYLYDVGDQRRLKPSLDDIHEGISQLREAVAAMNGRPGRVADHALAARKAGGAVCRKYQYEIAHLFEGDEMTTWAMKSRELARRLDIAGSNICEAADAVADGTMKRWH